MFRNAIRWTVLAAALASLPASAARADYEAGRAAWDAGQPGEAAAEWRAAADRGDARAMLALGRAFVKGLGVPRDYVEAHMWLNLAAGRGSAEAAAERDALTKEMTAGERAEARKLARVRRTDPDRAAAAAEGRSRRGSRGVVRAAGSAAATCDPGGSGAAGGAGLRARPGGRAVGRAHGERLRGVPAMTRG